MNKKIRISIQVGESKYPLWIEPKEEPMFREAARMVNDKLQTYSTKYRGANLPPEAILAMASIDLAVMYQRHEQIANTTALETNLDDVMADLRSFLDVQKQPDAQE